MKIKVIDSLTEDQILELFTLYKQEGWTSDRKLEDIKSMLSQCKIIGLVDEETNMLVGFTRMVTDYMYRATIYDVIVQRDYHGRGLGRILMDTIVNHPLLKHIERVDLYCANEKIDFYNKWNFNKVPVTTNYLTRSNTRSQ